MRDRETDSYWAIMSGKAIGGELNGTKLQELPFGEKMKWKDWVKKHPDTQVLSVEGREDGRDTYRSYFSSQSGFRGSKAKDKRFKTKEPIFSFHYNGKSYAVSHKKLKQGKVVEVDGLFLFLFRPKRSEMFQSTVVFQSTGSGFSRQNDQWIHSESGCVFNPESGSFEGESEACPTKFAGFDTFWYNWSLNNPETQVLD